MNYKIFNTLASQEHKKKYKSGWIYFVIYENLECKTFNTIEELLTFFGKSPNGCIYTENLQKIEINAYYDDGEYPENEVYYLYGKYFVLNSDYNGIIEAPKKDVDFWCGEYSPCSEAKHWNNVATNFERFNY